MKRKIISILIILSLLLNIMPLTNVYATDTSFAITITADKTTANIGDTITYTITANATSGLMVLSFYLDIPNGLSYVPGSGTLGAGVGTLAEKDITENDEGKLFTFADAEPFVLNNVQLGTFKCTVNEKANGKNTVGIRDLEVADENFEEISTSNITESYPTVDVLLNATGVSLNKTALSLKIGETSTLVAKLTPEGTTDTIKEWSSNNTSVATINNGVVTAVSEGKAVITVKTTNDKTATCTVTVTCPHTNKTEVTAKAATCSEAGNNKYYKCNDCSKIIKADGVTETTVEAETIKALGHDFSKENHNDTQHWKECSRCGEKSEVENHSSDVWLSNETEHWKECKCGVIINKAGHTAGAVVKENIVEATCKTKGKHDEVTYCTECGKELSRTTVEDKKLSHTPAKAVRENEKPATHSEKGSYDEVVYCSVCGDVISRTKKEIDIIPHDGSASPWYSSETEHWKVCGCGVKVDIANHEAAEMVKENIVVPTCTVDGKHDEVVYCSVCGYEISRTKDVVDKATGHKEGTAVKENEVAATCTKEGGYDEVVYCTVCNQELNRTHKVIEKLAHTPGELVKENEVQATCTTEGSYDEVVYCTVCKEELSREHKKVEKLGHKAGEPVKENEVQATCTKDGSYDEVVYCTVCKEELSREHKKVEKLAHKAGEPVKENEVQATCTKDGSYDEVVYCTVCKEELSREHKKLEKLAHTPGEPVKENEVQATVDKEGSYDEVIYCQTCKTELSRNKKTTPKFVYEVLEGKDGEHQNEKTETLTFRVNGEMSKFRGLKIDDKDVDKVNYTVKSGSTIVTLAADYLNTLSVGTHKIAFIYDDAEVATNFKVTEAAKATTDNKSNSETEKTSSETKQNTDSTTNETKNTATTESSNTTTTETPAASETPNTPATATTNNSQPALLVNTGDNSNIVLWIAGLAVSGILFVMVLKWSTKSQKRKK